MTTVSLTVTVVSVTLTISPKAEKMVLKPGRCTVLKESPHFEKSQKEKTPVLPGFASNHRKTKMQAEREIQVTLSRGDMRPARLTTRV